jgi:hypothetical protein
MFSNETRTTGVATIARIEAALARGFLTTCRRKGPAAGIPLGPGPEPMATEAFCFAQYYPGMHRVAGHGGKRNLDSDSPRKMLQKSGRSFFVLTHDILQAGAGDLFRSPPGAVWNSCLGGRSEAGRVHNDGGTKVCPGPAVYSRNIIHPPSLRRAPLVDAMRRRTNPLAVWSVRMGVAVCRICDRIIRTCTLQSACGLARRHISSATGARLKEQ